MDDIKKGIIITIEINPNFHTIGGKSVLIKNDSNFIEYRLKWKDWPTKFYTGNFPLHLDIEISSVCNLQCDFCKATIDKIGTNYGFMELKIFKKIIDEGVKYGLYAVKLNSAARGEPLINKNIVKMIEYAKKKGIIDVYFNTNGVLLTQELGRKLIDAKLDRISISFEGIEPAFYEKYRVGAKFDKVQKNILKIIELKRHLKSDIPKIRIQTVGLPEILPRIPEYVEFWSKYVDEIALIDLKDYKNLTNDLISDWTCPYLWQRMMVTWDGIISVCDSDYTDRYKLGNVKTGSIHAAWKGKEMELVRSLHRQGMSHKVIICNGCPFRTTEILKKSNH